jgi:hypothetical protein
LRLYGIQTTPWKAYCSRANAPSPRVPPVGVGASENAESDLAAGTGRRFWVGTLLKILYAACSLKPAVFSSKSTVQAPMTRRRSDLWRRCLPF